jgi:molybdate transport system substrate-binding protein
MRRALAVAAVLLALLSPLRAQQPPGRTLRVAAASDLRFALDALAAQLSRATPPVVAQITYGSSGTLHAQLRQRAPFDVYLSADTAYPQDLVDRGIGTRADLFTYARGHLVAWVPAGSRLPIEREGLAALRRATRVAIANPAHAPYGRAAEAALRNTGLWNTLNGRLLLGENIGQASQVVSSGGADAGLIAKSLAIAPEMQRAGRFVDVPSDSYPPLLQAGLILPWAASRDAALDLRHALLSADGRNLLTRFGFDLP